MRDDFLRCYYTRWAGEDNVKEDLIILENLYPQVGCSEIFFPLVVPRNDQWPFLKIFCYDSICFHKRPL